MYLYLVLVSLNVTGMTLASLGNSIILYIVGCKYYCNVRDYIPQGGASSTTAIIGVIIGTTVLAISTFM